VTPTESPLIDRAHPNDLPWAVVSLRTENGHKRVTLMPSRNSALKFARKLRDSGFVCRTWHLDGRWITLHELDHGAEQ
jgi:hypothetical protein